MAGTHGQHSAAFKAQVALTALKGDRTVNKLDIHFRIHPALIRGWKSSFWPVLTMSSIVIASRLLLDNVFVEHFWRTVKYEYIYLRRWEPVPELRQKLIRYLPNYNNERWHQSLGNRKPAAVYHGISMTGVGLPER